MQAYLDLANEHHAVRSGLAAAIGYCFGGQCLLEQVRAGHALQAVVSFHGLLQSRYVTVHDSGVHSACRSLQISTHGGVAQAADMEREGDRER